MRAKLPSHQLLGAHPNLALVRAMGQHQRAIPLAQVAAEVSLSCRGWAGTACRSLKEGAAELSEKPWQLKRWQRAERRVSWRPA